MQLLGARTLVSGIRPEVARMLIHLDIDLSNMRSVANLGEALAVAQYADMPLALSRIAVSP